MGSSLKDNRDIACYFITKHSWKGKSVSSLTLFINLDIVHY